MAMRPEAGNAKMDRSFLDASVDDIIHKLTLDEKIELLAGADWWHTVPIPRLNVPSVKVTDGPNGARGDSFFKMTKGSAIPCETCLAASFSAPLVKEAGELLAAEAKARGAVCLLAPTINIQRSPLGGRAFESFSEDPTLSGQLAAAYVNGLQGKGVSAAIKHFVANDQEHERNGADSVVAARPLREIYLRPFQIAAKDAEPWATMTAYNKLNGIHCSEDPWLLQDLLRKEWGYSGMVMSDWYGTYSVSEAINAGLALEMPGSTTWRQPAMVRHLVSSHKIDPKAIDARAREVLSWVQKLAKRNPDLVYSPPEGEQQRNSDAERASDAKILRRLAGEGVVLLKNDHNILPITKGKVAVIGPNAKARVITGGGSAALRALWAVSPWDGMHDNKPSGVELSYALGLMASKFLPEFDETFTTMDGKPGFDLLHYAIGADGKRESEPTVRDVHDGSDMFMGDFNHPDLGKAFISEVHAKFTAPVTGKYEFGIVVTGQGWLYVDDKLVIDDSRKQEAGSKYFGNGMAEKKGIVDVEKGKTYDVRFVHDTRAAPDRDMSVGTPFRVNGMWAGAAQYRTVDETIAEAVATAKAADKVVLVAGLNADWESEGYDRPDLSLPLRSNELITKVAEANPNTVVVIQSGSAVAMPWLDKVAGVLQAWYGGNETGNGIADVVYGVRNPSGRMPLSFPKREQDIAAALNYKSARKRVHYGEGIWVGYKHHNALDIAPLFPFGAGLSYTSFAYSDLKVSAGTKDGKWSAQVSVSVANTGNVAGDHSVHFYTAPPAETATGLSHPEVALQAFAKVYDLAPGQSKSVEVALDKYAISHWDELDSEWKAEVGEWHVKIGTDAQTMVAEAAFAVDDEMPWRGL